MISKIKIKIHIKFNIKIKIFYWITSIINFFLILALKKILILLIYKLFYYSKVKKKILEKFCFKKEL